MVNFMCKVEMGICYDLIFLNFIWVGNRKNILELNIINRYFIYVEL